MRVDGVERQAVAWDGWAITTQIDTAAYWRQVWCAVACYRWQLLGYEVLRTLPDEHHRGLWGAQTFYRALSLAGGGRDLERDLFAGLRQ